MEVVRAIELAKIVPPSWPRPVIGIRSTEAHVPPVARLFCVLGQFAALGPFFGLNDRYADCLALIVTVFEQCVGDLDRLERLTTSSQGKTPLSI
jgi:hypothetical protein